MKSETQIESEAVKYARAHKKDIARRVTDKSIYLPEDDPVSVFMAGSPGAGKTEASKALIQNVTGGKNDILRIDADELREELPGYDGKNSYLFQGAVSVLIEKIHDLALKQKQSFVLDGTLSKLGKAKENIKRSLNKDRTVQILYVYQDPKLAWDFVCAREAIEGRNIRAEYFITQYFSAREVVNTLKEEFGRAIKVDLLIKNIDNSDRVYKANIDVIDNHVPEKYAITTLERLIQKP